MKSGVSTLISRPAQRQLHEGRRTRKAEQLAGGNVGVALLANTLATAGALVALILPFGPISDAHFNPAVTLTLAIRKKILIIPLTKRATEW
jgi:glycerol uptake facilitator-like aquaporin